MVPPVTGLHPGTGAPCHVPSVSLLSAVVEAQMIGLLVCWRCLWRTLDQGHFPFRIDRWPGLVLMAVPPVSEMTLVLPG